MTQPLSLSQAEGICRRDTTVVLGRRWWLLGVKELCCVTGLISSRVGRKNIKGSNLRASVGGGEKWVREK